MLVEDEIRAKGLGVVLEGSLIAPEIGDEEDEENDELSSDKTDEASAQNLETRYYRARFEACREGLWFSVALNAILLFFLAWTAWR